MSRLLRDANLRSLVSARTLVFFGNAIGTVALSFGILALPGGSGAELGVVLFARSTAQIALLLFGGVLGDRYSKPRLMMTADLVAGVSQLGTGLCVIGHLNDIGLLVALSCVNGGATGLFLPVSTGIIPEVVDRSSSFQAANAALRVSINVANIAGSAMAGLLVTTIGTGFSLTVNALTYLGSAWCLSRLRVVRSTVRQATSLGRELLDGWRSFVGTRWIWMIVTQAAIINALFKGATQILGPVEASRQPHGAWLWALALAAQTVGLLLGSAVAMRVRPRHPLRVAAVCIALLALPLLLLGSGLPLLVVGVAMCTTGVATDLFTVLWETALQSNVDPAVLSRVSSYDALGSFALAPLGLVVAGALADSSARSAALDVGGVIVIVVGLVVLLSADVRNLRDVGDRSFVPDGDGDQVTPK